MSEKDSGRFVTVRDYKKTGSKDGTFYINVHRYTGEFFESRSFPYKQKRTARRIAKRLAKREGYEYRQDMEYSCMPAEVGPTTPLVVEAEVIG
jgi:hypothetical protein